MSTRLRHLLACVSLLAALGLGGCAHSSVHSEPELTAKGFEASRSTQAQLDAGLAPRRWAVIVGVDTYEDPSFTPLRFASADAASMAWTLRHKDYGGFDRVITLTSAEATHRANILFELGRLRNDLRRQDTLVVYFSGHGTMEFTASGQPRLYLVSHDTRLADLFGTAIELNTLRQFLSDLKPQRKVLILDSCFNGLGKSQVSAVTQQRLAQPGMQWESSALSMGQSEAVLMASTTGGVALEDSVLGHGIYTSWLLRGLTTDRTRADANSDGAITAWEAHDFARAGTLEHSKKQQVPEGLFRLVGRADMYLSGTPDALKAQEAALVYAYNRAGNSRLSLEVDGQAKGVFPRTVAVAPGVRSLALKDEGGRVMAQGRIELAAGQVWSVESLMEELRGYRRFFGASAGGMVNLHGPTEQLWGGGAPGMTLTSGYRVRGGPLYGLSFGLELGWSPATVPGNEAARASVPQAIEPSGRSVFSGGGLLTLRRPLGWLEIGPGWHWTAQYVGATTSASGETSTFDAAQQPWLLLPSGPVLWLGVPVAKNLRFTVDLRASMLMGEYQAAAQTSLDAGKLALPASFLTSGRMGLELGF